MLTQVALSTLALAIFSCTTSLAADEMIIARPYQTTGEKRVDNPVDAWIVAVKGPGGSASNKRGPS